jgi:hypothetical protein
MRGFRMLACGVLSAACLTVATPDSGQAQTLQSCLSGQLRYAGTACRGLGRCYMRAMKKSIAVDTACLNDVLFKLQSKFSTVESNGDCLVEPAGPTVANMIDNAMDSQANALGVNFGGRCAAGKMGGVGRACKQMIACYARAVEGSEPAVDPFCIGSSTSKMEQVFSRLEEKYTSQCVTTGDAAARDGENQTLTSDIYNYIRGTGTTTTTTSMSTSTTTIPAGVCPEDGGFAPCTGYRDDPACSACVDAVGGIAQSQCTGAGPACGDSFQNQACGYAINTTTSCSEICCPP